MSENRTRHLVMVDAASANATYTSDFQRSVAVVIGINDYRNGIPRLNTAVNDARRLAELLCHEHKYTVHLLAEEVTKTRLTDFLRTQLPGEIDQASRLLLYFAGHGIVLDSDDGPAGYLVPQDADTADIASFLPMTDLHAWLEALPCRHVLLILDCCFAGAIRWNNMRNLAIHPQQIYRERYQLFVRSSAWQAITSAAYDEKALDILKTGDIIGRRAVGIDAQHSPFALALFDALNGAGDTYPPGQNGQPAGDGLLTANELFQYLRDHVALKAQQVANHRQTPGLWPLKKHQAGEYVFQMPGRTLNLKPALPPATENNPYRGLKSYDEQDASLFFGRTQLIEQLAQQVAVQPLMLVLGASGTGKSSLVKAGLLPYLRRQADEPSSVRTWHILPPMRPGDQPLSTLVKLLCDELATGSTAVTGAQAEGGVDHADGARTALLRQSIAHWRDQQPEQRLLLVIDQFEELITLCREEAARQTFLAQLAELVHTYPYDLRLVITLRTDFEPQFADSALYKQQVTGARRFIVPPLSQAELREVIEKPAMLRVLYFDPPALVDRLIDEVVQTPGALPLLSFTLEQLYLKYVARYGAARNLGQTIDRAFTMADYDALGGVIGSLRTRADEEYNQLPDDAHRATMQRVMLRMVAVEGGEVARRRVMVAELTYPNDEENIRVKAVIARLVDARLVVSDRIDIDGDAISDAYIEPAHDALVRAWDRLRGWQVTAEHGLPLSLHRTLTQSATDWLRAPQHDKSGLLWNNSPWLAQLKNETLPALEGQFDALDYWLDPSLLLHQAAQIRTKPTRFNLQETEFIIRSTERRTFLWQRAIAITTAVILALTGVSVIAELQRQNAVEQRQVAESERDSAQRELAVQIASQSQVAAERHLPQRRLLLALEANAITTRNDNLPVPQAEQALRDALANSGGTVLAGHTDAIQAIAISPNNRWLALGSTDTTVTLWDLYNLATPAAILTEHEKGVRSLQFSPDQHWLVTCDEGGICLLWRFDNEQLAESALRLSNGDSGGGVSAIAFSASGRWLAVCYTAEARLWDMESTDLGASQKVLKTRDLYLTDLTFSPDEHWLATVGGPNDAAPYLWDITSDTPEQDPLIFPVHHSNEIRNVAFSSNMHWLATASWDGTAMLWDLTQDKWKEMQPFVLDDHEGGVMQVAFSPDNRWLVTGSRDQTARLWNLTTENPAATSDELTGHTASINKLAITADSQWLLTASDDGLARLWVLAAYAPENRDKVFRHMQAQPAWSMPIDLRGHEDAIWATALSSDQQWLVTGGSTGTARVWNLTVTDPAVRTVVFPGNRSAISPHGRWLVTSDKAGAVRFWDLATTQPNATPVAYYASQKPAMVMGFSLDGQWFFSASEDYQVYLWQIGENGPSSFPRLLTGHEDTIRAVAISPDNRWLVTGSLDQTVRLWPVQSDDPSTSAIVLSGHHGGVLSLAIDSMSRRLATGSLDHSVLLWDLHAANPAAQPRIIAEHKDYVDSVIFSQQGWLVTGSSSSNDNTVRLWKPDEAGGYHHAFTFPHHAGALSISPDARWLASASWASEIQLWEITAPNPSEQPIVLTDHLDSVWSMAFTTDGRLITGSDDHTARIWNLTTTVPGADSIMLLGHRAPIRSISVSADHHWLVTSDEDDKTRLWNLHTNKLFDLACQIAGRNLSFSEWRTYFGDTEYRRTCPGWPAHPTVVEHFKDLGTVQAQRGQIELAANSLQQAMNLDPSLQFIPTVEAQRIYQQAQAEELVKEGEELARALEITEAIKRFSTAKTLAPVLNLDPQTRAAEIAVPILINQGRNLAYQADVDGAIAKFTMAKALDPTQKLDPQAEAKTLAVTTLLAEGRELAKALAVERAQGIFDRAANIDPTQADIWVTEASRIAIAVLLEEVRKVLQTGQTANAKRQLQQAIDLADKIDSAFWQLQICALQNNQELKDLIVDNCAKAAASAQTLIPTARVTNISIPSGGDVWSIRGQLGEGIMLTMTSNTLNPLHLTLYSPDYALLLDTISWSTSFTETAIFPIEGTYLIAVYGNREDKGLYSLQATSIPTNVIAAQQLVEKGQLQAKQGKLEGAIALFQQAHLLNPSLDLEPDVEAKRIRFESLVASAAQITEMDDEVAMALLDQALVLVDAVPAVSARQWNLLCWWGSLYGFAQRIVNGACQQAVAQAEGVSAEVGYRDSRGLARILTGDVLGAIADFEFVVQWAKEENESEAFVTSRQAWLDALKAGTNPFDAALLEQLKKE